jgi:hypothetical protein
MNDRCDVLEWYHVQKYNEHVCYTPKDEAAADQAVGEVMAHQTFDRYGP